MDATTSNSSQLTRSEGSATQDSVTVASTSTDSLSSVELIKSIYRKIDAIENFLISLSVKVDNLRDGSKPDSPIGVVDIAVLAENGLPADSLTELEKLENSLKNSQEFKTNLVSTENSFSKITKFHLYHFQTSKIF